MIADLIRSRRKARGLTQVQLAEKLNTSQVAVSDWERGKSIPRNLPLVMHALNIDREEAAKALSTKFDGDPVLSALDKTTNVSAGVRDAFILMYKQAVLADKLEKREQND